MDGHGRDARTDLATRVLSELEIERYPVDALPDLAVLLSALLGRVTLRMLATAMAPPPPPAEYIDLPAVVRLIGRSESWIRRHPHAVPGRYQPIPGGPLRWDKAAVLRWLAAGAPLVVAPAPAAGPAPTGANGAPGAAPMGAG